MHWEHRPLFEGAGQRAPSRWPWRGGFARQSVPWRCPCWPWVRLCALLTHAATLGVVSAEQKHSTKALAAYSLCWKLGTDWSALLIKAFAQETSPKVQWHCLVALHTSPYSQLLSGRCNKTVNRYQVEDGRINPKIGLYFALVSSKHLCCDQREVVCSKSI